MSSPRRILVIDDDGIFLVGMRMQFRGRTAFSPRHQSVPACAFFKTTTSILCFSMWVWARRTDSKA